MQLEWDWNTELKVSTPNCGSRDKQESKVVGVLGKENDLGDVVYGQITRPVDLVQCGVGTVKSEEPSTLQSTRITTDNGPRDV